MQSSPVVNLPTKFGPLCVKVGNGHDLVPPWVVIYKQPWENIPFLRIHSSCLFSESFHSADCDCAMQLTESLKTIADKGGAIVYLYQEGRGAGLFRKAVAMATEQELSLDTASAFMHHGFELDSRQYEAVKEALSSIDFPREIRLATNNPRKIKALEEFGYIVTERALMDLSLTERHIKYLKSKVQGLGHYDWR